MNDAEKQFERIVAGLNIDDAADSRHKADLREQMLAAYAKSAPGKSSRSVWQAWSKIMKSNITRTAAAAILLIGILLTWMALADKNDEKRIVGPTPEPKRQVLPNETHLDNDIQMIQQAQLKLAGQLYETQNVAALAALFEAGTTETKLAVANYLSEIGTDEAFEALKLLDTSDTEPKVQQAVEAIKQPKTEPVSADNHAAAQETALPQTPDKSGDESQAAAVESQKQADAEEGYRIIIKVIEKDTGKPLSDADIRTYDGKKNPKARTNNKGIYTIVTDQTAINLFAAKEGYVSQSFCCGPDVLTDYIPEEVTFQMEKGTVVGGVVHDSDGKPLAGATVSLDSHSGLNDDKPGMDVRFRQKTDEQGRWRCSIAPENLEGCSVGAGYPGYAASGVLVTGKKTIDQLRTETHILTLSEGYSILGTVKDESGHPIQNARIQLGSWYGFKDNRYRTHTNAEGYFEFKNRRGGDYVTVSAEGFYVTVSAEGFAPNLMIAEINENDAVLEFVLTPGSPVHGRVIDFEGKPVSNATVRADNWGRQPYDHVRSIDWNAKTDADGRFIWLHAPAEEVQLTISKEGYLTLETPTVIPSGAEYEFVLNPKVRVKGQVVDAVTKEPISEFIFRRYEGGTISWPKKIIDEKGQFETAFDDQGETFIISFEADGYKPTSSRKISLIEQDVELLIEMQPDAGLDGVVVDMNGNPLEDIRVMIPGSWMHSTNAKVESNLRSIPNTVTDNQGRFHLGPVAQEEYSMLILDDTGYLFMHSSDFPEDGRFVLQPYARIVGTYYKGSKPVTNERIRIDYPRYHQVSKGNGVWGMGPSFAFNTQTDGEGRFVFDKLIHGTARILIDPYQNVELKAGETKEVHFGGNGLMVTGHCLTPDGEVLNEDFGDCPIGLRRIYDTLPFPESDIPLPDNADAMSYTELMTWFTEFGGSDAGQQWLQEMEQKYGELQKSYSAKIDPNGRFEMANVEPGTYLLSMRAYAWQDPDQFPRHRDYGNMLAKATRIVIVPEFETAEEMDVPVDVGTLQSRTAPLAVGDIAPEFDVEKLTGPGRFRLSDYRGQTVLVNFTNPALKDIEPDAAALLEQVCQKASGKAAIVNVAMEMMPWEFMRAKMRPLCTLPGLYGVAQMHSSKIYDDYKTVQKSETIPLPYSILIDPTGTILWKGESSEELVNLLADLP